MTMDTRDTALASLLVNYSVKVQPGENVYIDCAGKDAAAFVPTLIDEIHKAGGNAFVHLSDRTIERHMILTANEEQLKKQADNICDLMKQMNCYIGFSSVDNSAELSGIPDECMQRWDRCYIMPIAMVRCSTTRWVVLRYPSAASAQATNMDTESYRDFYFKISTMDYQRMDEAMKPLKALMDRTDRVHIKGPGTDLTFSIKGIGSVPCAGTCNLPDGEVYTAPVRDSVNGTITYNTPAPFGSFVFERISFTFKDGKIVDAAANDTAKLNSYLDCDEGARYVGEFALGMNPFVTFPVKNTLYDEKIAGSFHFTPGMSYHGPGGNGNESNIHWDLVCIQTPEYGGGEIWFDDVLIRKDGLFVLPELAPLNPDQLGC